jgi:hypothetical protein
MPLHATLYTQLRARTIGNVGWRAANRVVNHWGLVLVASVACSTPDVAQPPTLSPAAPPSVESKREKETPPPSEPAPPEPASEFPVSDKVRQLLEKFNTEQRDEDWAVETESVLRERFKTFNRVNRKLMLLECRSYSCVVGYIRFDPAKRPRISWSGLQKQEMGARPDGWSEVVELLFRHAHDHEGVGEQRVRSFDPPQCPGGRPYSRASSSSSCVYVTGRAEENGLCFHDWQSACRCACGQTGGSTCGEVGNRYTMVGCKGWGFQVRGLPSTPWFPGRDE